jgi:hypothetical protein
MRAGAEFYILPSKRSDLAIAQASLGSEKQKRPVPPPDPCGEVGSFHDCGNLFFREKLHLRALVAFGWERQDTLTV